MSNHVHLVVKLAPEAVNNWCDREVLERWTSLYKGPLLVQHCLKGVVLPAAELTALNDIIALYRKRLADLGWFIKCLNEPIALTANREDGCSGHFWEARYKSQALLTEEALLSCMAYVDLNPVRADIAPSPEQSEHTNIKE